MTKKSNEIDNKFEFGLAIIKYWKQLIALILVAGAIMFVLQIKNFQCGTVAIQKEPLKATPMKK
jgi:hypothetical protein